MERFSVGDVVRVVNAIGSPHLNIGETRIVITVDEPSGYVRVTECTEWLWPGRFERLPIGDAEAGRPLQTVTVHRCGGVSCDMTARPVDVKADEVIQRPNRQTVADVDGNQIGAGDWVEYVDLHESMASELTIGCRYHVAGVPNRCGETATITNDQGYTAHYWSRRFRKLSTTPLERREDA